jgi:hypothetical protein
VSTPSSFTMVLTESIAFAEGSSRSTSAITSSLNGIDTAQPLMPRPRTPAMAEGRSVVVKAL